MRIVILLSTLLLLVLASCQPGGTATPEQAAVLQVSRPNQPNVVVDSASIEVLSTQNFNDSIYVVLRYNRNWDGRNENCLGIVETHRPLLGGWQAGSGIGSCMERQLNGEKPSEPMHISGGSTSRKDQSQEDVSYVFGRVEDPAIVKITVTWQDAQTQQVEVENGVFIAIRLGQDEMKSAVGLNADDEVVYSVNR